MTAQTKILDAQARNLEYIETLPNDILDDVLELVASICTKNQ